MTIGAALFLIAVGAILRWAVTAHIAGIDIHTVGLILLVVGIAGLVLSLVWTLRTPRRPAADPYARDPADPYARGRYYDDPSYRSREPI